MSKTRTTRHWYLVKQVDLDSFLAARRDEKGQLRLIRRTTTARGSTPISVYLHESDQGA